MKLKEIFDRDIYREINPAIVVSDRKQATIEAEISEYVFTDELIEKLFKVVDTILNKRSGKAGIWINGYYGSGKSHFIKYVHYLLDGETSEIAFKGLLKAVENYDSMRPGANDAITISNVTQLQKKVKEAGCEDILFNVEDETDDGSKERLTRIFLNMFNKFRGFNAVDIPLALLLEKPLHNLNLLDHFKNAIKSKLGYDWATEAAQISGFHLGEILEVAKEINPKFDVDALHNKLTNPEAFPISINGTLIPELKAFLKDKPSSFRLLFLVDEVSQYVGSNKEILLNFQNIIERVSEDCNNQIWIACTAQQTLEDVSLGTDGLSDLQDEFGKILGRFDTRISLQSNDASIITQRRVLDKNSVGIQALDKLYDDNKDYIENQFKINHDLYKGYLNRDQFISSYPFVPYQFKLIANVFEAFQHLNYVIKEVKDNERSVLGITHFTTKEHAEETVGGFIPFDAFYNQQFHTNLTNRGSKAVQLALDLTYVKNNTFAQRVVKVLFMISNLLESQRQTFPSSIDNLTVLLMDQLDQNKKKLQTDIKEVLDKLIAESVIREENNSYFYFTEDEIDVQNMIKSQTITLDDRWTELDDFFRRMVSLSQKVTFGKNDFSIKYSVENKEIFRRGDFNIIALFLDHTPQSQKALQAHPKDLIICINQWFTANDQLKKEFDWYCKTKKYFTHSGSDGSGGRAKTNESFKLRNVELKEKIMRQFNDHFASTTFISQNRIVNPDVIKGSTPQDRMKNLIDFHLNTIYKNHKLSESYANNTQDLKASARDTQVIFPALTPAEIMVDDYISLMNNQSNVHDLIEKYSMEPFGWRHEALLDILVNLVKKKRREFVYKGQDRYPIVDFINKAITTSERQSCEVVKGAEIDQTVLTNTIKAFKFIFNETLKESTDSNELFNNLLSALELKRKRLQTMESDFYGQYPFGKTFHEALILLNEWVETRNPEKLFMVLIDGQLVAKELFDRAKGLEEFGQNRISEYQKIQLFCKLNAENFKELESESKNKANILTDFLTIEDPRNEFRHAMKAYEELKLILEGNLVNFKTEALNAYEDVFKTLEDEATKRNVPITEMMDQKEVIKEIEVTNSIPTLRYKISNLNNFKSGEIQKIVNYASQQSGSVISEPESYFITQKTSTISSEEELETYLKMVRKDMKAMLDKKKTIILR